MYSSPLLRKIASEAAQVKGGRGTDPGTVSEGDERIMRFPVGK